MQMTQTITLCLLLLAINGAGCASRVPAARPATLQSSTGFHLELVEGMEPQREFYRRQVNAALDQVVGWFGRHGFVRSREGIVERVVVFASRREMKRRMGARFKISPDKIPDTLSGTVDGKTLLLVTREMFAKTYASLYPRFTWTDKAYTRLMAHELAHRVHAMIAVELFGTEDGMGPRWFFDGLAIACADQFPAVQKPLLSWEQLMKRVQRDGPGGQSYPIYKRMFRSLAASYPVEHLVRAAGKAGFLSGLKADYLPSEMVFEHPEGRRPLGSILLIHGSAPFNLDGRIPLERAKSPYARTHFYRDLSARLRQKGWSVLRYSKPGVQLGSVDQEAYARTDLTLLSRQLRNIWRFLPRDRPRVVFAWSEGALHVRALPVARLDGVVLLGGIATNIAAVIQAQGGPPPEALRKQLATSKRTDMLGLDRPVGRLLDELALDDNWRTFAPHKTIPLLVLHGTADREVPVAQARIWKTLLPGHLITLVEGKGRDHRFMESGKYEVNTLAERVAHWAKRVVLKKSR